MNGVLFLAALLLWSAAGSAAELQSGPAKVSLFELYTSEGCSSCPPADQFLSALRMRGDLWDKLVPVAFHVDYWDNLGWPDPLARAAHSERQRRYQRSGAARAVYTPGFFLDGREWRGFYARPRQPPEPDAHGRPGTLTLHTGEHNGGRLQLTFAPADGAPTIGRALTAHVAWLGFGIERNVRHGENAGRRLSHDFAVIKAASGRSTADADGTFRFVIRDAGPANAGAIAAWVAGPDPAPVQAVGGWLGEHPGTR